MLGVALLRASVVVPRLMCFTHTHTHTHTHRRHHKMQQVNLQWKRVWWEEGNCFVRLRLSTKAIKTLKTKVCPLEFAILASLCLFFFASLFPTPITAPCVLLALDSCCSLHPFTPDACTRSSGSQKVCLAQCQVSSCRRLLKGMLRSVRR